MRVLIADDDKVNRQILTKLLEKWGYEAVVVTNGDEAWQILQQESAPRLAILDWMMPGMDGAQICREIRKRNEPLYTYIVLVTAKFQKQDILEGLGAGADDYVTKPFDFGELRARLRTGQRVLELQEALLSTQERLHRQATHDSLTGVWNRGAILEILKTELARSERSGAPVGVILIDLDHFKRVNDTFGHLAGDAVLREATQRMKTCVRPYDLVGRYGGEEFLSVVPGADRDRVRMAAERMREAIEKEPAETAEGKIPVTISAGTSSHPGTGPCDMEALLRDADVALYRAKERGRNRVEAAPEPNLDEPLPLFPDTSVATGVASPTKTTEILVATTPEKIGAMPGQSRST